MVQGYSNKSKEGIRKRRTPAERKFCQILQVRFSDGENTRIIEVENRDKTGTNECSIIRIARNTAEECQQEFDGQLTDGAFENSATGKIEEIL